MNGVASTRQLYVLTDVFGILGCMILWPEWGFKTALAFLLGALAAHGNLFLFSYLTRVISPAGGARKPWQTGAFLTRYLLLFAAGYVTVKVLDVNPLAVIAGLLCSTAAAISSIGFELIQRLFTNSTTH